MRQWRVLLISRAGGSFTAVEAAVVLRPWAVQIWKWAPQFSYPDLHDIDRDPSPSGYETIPPLPPTTITLTHRSLNVFWDFHQLLTKRERA